MGKGKRTRLQNAGKKEELLRRQQEEQQRRVRRRKIGIGVGAAVVILGGSLKKTDETIASNMTIANAQTINYNKVFSGAMGISAACGITQPEPVLAELDRVLTSRAGKVYLLADHTKFGVVGPYTAYSMQQVHSIVTEKHPCVLEELEKAEQFSGNVLYVDE